MRATGAKPSHAAAADLIGYFAPHEGSSTLAYGVYNIESLGAYEVYRARLAADPLGRENYDFAQKVKIPVARGQILPEARFLSAYRKGLAMIAVIFEVEPQPGRKDDYLDMAASMRVLVERIDGFISVERFQSLTNPEKLLSVSFFRDEDALDEWRQLTAHRSAQKKGREEYFAGYRLRVASVIRDYGMNDREQAPQDSLAIHSTQAARPV